jgi:hypothetical protein
MISDIHHIVVNSQEGIGGQNRSVSTTRTRLITEQTLTDA